MILQSFEMGSNVQTRKTLREQPLDLRNARDLLPAVSLAQAIYYVVTGLWGIVSINTFQKVTGPKVDIWLVKTVSLLVVSIGGVLGIAGYRRNPEPEVPALGISSAASLAAIDVIYTAKGRIRPVYLLDALAEAILIGAWAFAWRRKR